MSTLSSLTSDEIDAVIAEECEIEDLLVAKNVLPDDIPVGVAADLLLLDREVVDDCYAIGASMLGNDKKKEHKQREHIPRVPKEDSHWYRRYLAPEQRLKIHIGESNTSASKKDKKIALEFCSAFGVHWSVFVELFTMLIERNTHDPNKTDTLNFSHDPELLLLGSLFFIGWDTTFSYVKTLSETDKEQASA